MKILKLLIKVYSHEQPHTHWHFFFFIMHTHWHNWLRWQTISRIKKKKKIKKENNLSIIKKNLKIMFMQRCYWLLLGKLFWPPMAFAKITQTSLCLGLYTNVYCFQNKLHSSCLEKDFLYLKWNKKSPFYRIKLNITYLIVYKLPRY